MAEHLEVSQGSKAERYQTLTPQLYALIDGEQDAIAAMANCAAAIQQTFGWLWTGFYRVIGNELVLGPFQGPIACTRIPHGKGVCGSSWAQARTLVVPDVDQFPGHIACSSAARSEIVIPLFNQQGKVVAVLDIDADELAQFDDSDRMALEPICQLLGKLFD